MSSGPSAVWVKSGSSSFTRRLSQFSKSRRAAGFGILLNDEARRGVLHHHGAEPVAHTGLSHHGLDLVGDLVEALVSRRNGDALGHG